MNNKKLALISSVLLIIIILFCSCNSTQAGKEQRFIYLQKDGRFTIFGDTVTGVCYLVYDYDRAYGQGSGITVLLDEDGKPLLYNK